MPVHAAARKVQKCRGARARLTTAGAGTNAVPSLPAKIATAAYGKASQWTVIFYANQDRLGANSDKLLAGLLSVIKPVRIELADPSGDVRRVDLLSADSRSKRQSKHCQTQANGEITSHSNNSLRGFKGWDQPAKDGMG